MSAIAAACCDYGCGLRFNHTIGARLGKPPTSRNAEESRAVPIRHLRIANPVFGEPLKQSELLLNEASPDFIRLPDSMQVALSFGYGNVLL